MILWFVGTSVLTVWLVFRDPSIDMRMVVIGALLPDILDAGLGGVAHSVTFSSGALLVVMIATHGRRRARRLLVMVVVGMFLHLVFDGAVANSRTFWWPFTGIASPHARLPSIDRGFSSLVLELVGAGLCGWLWIRFGLGDRARRHELLHHGKIGGRPR